MLDTIPDCTKANSRLLLQNRPPKSRMERSIVEFDTSYRLDRRPDPREAQGSLIAQVPLHRFARKLFSGEYEFSIRL